MEWREGLREDVADGVVGFESAVLGEVAEVCWCGDRAVVGLLDPGDETDERRLARTVFADETDALARCDGEVDGVEDGAAGIAVRDVADGEWVGHGTPAGRFECSRGRVASGACVVAGSVLHDAHKASG